MSALRITNLIGTFRPAVLDHDHPQPDAESAALRNALSAFGQCGEPHRNRTGSRTSHIVKATPAWSLAFIGGDSAREAGLVLRCGCRVTFDNET
jgi:hypothetical protein